MSLTARATWYLTKRQKQNQTKPGLRTEAPYNRDLLPRCVWFSCGLWQSTSGINRIYGTGSNSFLPLCRCGWVIHPGSSLLFLHCVAFVLGVMMTQDMGCDVSIMLFIGFMVIPFPTPNAWKKGFISLPWVSNSALKRHRDASVGKILATEAWLWVQSLASMGCGFERWFQYRNY